MTRASRHEDPETLDPFEDLETFKLFLGSLAQGYTDAQLRQLQRDMHIAANLLLDTYLERKRETEKK